MARIERTAKGLRDALFDELDRLRNDEDADHMRALAVVKVASGIINIARAEMDFQARMNKDERLCDDFMTGQLRLGGSGRSESVQTAPIEGAVSVPRNATGR